MATFRLALPLHKRTLLVFAPVVLLVVITGVLSLRSKGEFRLGFIGSLTGPQAEVGRESLDGAALAIEECNEAGGIMGQSVRLLIRDDQGDARALLVGLDDLLRHGARAAVGPTAPTMAELSVAEAGRKGLLLLSPTVGVDRESPRETRITSVYPTAWSVAEQITTYMARRHLLKPALVVDSACAPPGMMSSLQRSIPFATESIVSTTTYDSSSGIVVTDLLDGVLETGPDCIIIFAAPRDTACFMQHLRRRSAMLPVIAGEASATATLTSLAGSAAEGLVVVRTATPTSAPGRYARFRKSFVSRYGREPGFAAVHGYDSARLLLTAASREPEGPLRRSTLAASSFEGVQGRIMFTDAGDVRRELSCAVVRNGALEPID